MKPNPGYWKLYFSMCVIFATIGFIVIFWFFLHKWDQEAVEKIKWPWQTNVQNGEHEEQNVQNQQPDHSLSQYEILYSQESACFAGTSW